MRQDSLCMFDTRGRLTECHACRLYCNNSCKQDCASTKSDLGLDHSKANKQKKSNEGMRAHRIKD
jgi:hypothetical protein